jgi:Leucine-rich repeat (LRR) protein
VETILRCYLKTFLKTLETLYLNDEKNLNLPQSLSVLAKLPNLKSLYLDNDRINYMPTEMLKLENLEYLSLRQNTLKEFPKILILYLI